ncbi:hypothetical protein SH1V18_00550 [Vallitalea longa]|uniref:Uncharacterized protein n=1 Tax=Vallitalea longa TaxID=2936439 RepID=A0A9W5Y805_9FIRM|nr:hypothetical protein [Vallitalea longa]GKX27575.1 hypothetical protein SH1V18_00550 [Vallitalea longa]
MKRKSIALLLVGFIVLIGALYLNYIKNTNPKYTLEELRDMPEKELYQLFVDNGLRVHDDFSESFSDEKMANIFKRQFDFIIKTEGKTNLSHTGYRDMAEDTYKIYKRIVK